MALQVGKWGYNPCKSEVITLPSSWLNQPI